MKKRLLSSRLILSSLILCVLTIFGLDYYGFFLPPVHNHATCAFCKKKVIDTQAFYEGEHCLGLITHKPVNEHHVLFIPKRHVSNFEDLESYEVAEIMELVKRVNLALKKQGVVESYTLLIKNGETSGQHVPHVHFHYIPRVYGEKTMIAYLFKFYLSGFKKPISFEEQQKEVAWLKDALEVK
jgi:diadenosine tetraphosphate (Ap4A) HIT family hydrolase